jgi:DNA-binding winged helix-turn-helix (wHTH) protein
MLLRMSREPAGLGVDVRLFGPFRLDVAEQRLWKGAEALRLRRKPFAILRFLAENPLRLVTQEEVVAAVWGKIAMSESLLRTHMTQVRRVLGEGVIETVVGRGYRFLLDVERHAPPAAAPEQMEARATGLVGRREEMDFLRQAFEAVLDRKRLLLFLAGDPGIGKTTLIDAFLTQVALPRGAIVATGGCVEQFGASEAYLPVFTALAAACRAPGGGRVAEVLERHAPTWLAQMPGLVADEKVQALHLRIQGATQGRMVREIAEALDALSSERPVVLVLEDMQWSDRSTLDLVAMLGARRDPARVLVIATCRPAELTKADGLARIIAEARGRKQAHALNLANFSEASVGDYLAHRFASHRFPTTLAAAIHGMTSGSPLFTVGVVDDLEARGMIRHVDGAYQLAASIEDVTSRRPETVRQLIDIQIDRLSSNEQRVLEAGGVFAARFAVTCVAKTLGLPADDVETLCERLASELRFLRFVSTEPWPDGTIQSVYAFSHALYRDAALARIPSATRRAWHRSVAEGMELGYGDLVDGVASELAVHFEHAQVIRKAVRYYCLAGERAIRRFGRADALAQFTRARALLPSLATSEDSERAELAVLRQVGPAIIALQGTQDPFLDQTFARTADLARKLGDDGALHAALLGRQCCHFIRGELPRVEDYEAEVSDVLVRLGDPVAAAEASVVAWSARLARGQLVAAQPHLVQACKTLDAAESDAGRIVNAPVVGLWSGQLCVLAWLLGAPDEAMALASRMIAPVAVPRDPFHLATALTITALVHMWRREPEKTLETARRALHAAREVGSPVWQGRAMALYHWAATSLEPHAASMNFDELSSVLPRTLVAGPSGRTAFAPCVAKVYAAAGHPDRALREIDDALAYVEASDERAWSSEVHRLRGDLLAEDDPMEARRAFAMAADISRRQGAKSFELRAAISLAKMSRGAKRHAAIEQLRRVHASFTEGFETGDLLDAASLL